MDEIVLNRLRNNEIAKFCGWSMIENANTMVLGGAWVGYPPKNQIIGKKERIPNYFNDLNAMHEAEKTLDVNIKSGDSPRYAYSRNIYSIIVPKDEQPFRASAESRAEAFLKTINKWDINE